VVPVGSVVDVGGDCIGHKRGQSRVC
jgi:hypothetical protein